METDEILQLYQELLDLIRSLELNWLADQVVEEINFGRVVSTDLQSRRADMTENVPRLFEELPHSNAPIRTPREDVLAIEEYSPEDRLRLLLDAIEEGVVNTGSMQNQLVEQLIPEASNIQRIEFYSEVTSEITMTIEKSRSQEIRETGDSLTELLARIRSEIG